MPRWRSVWITFDPDLIEPYPASGRETDYWRDQLSLAVTEAAAALGVHR